MKIIDKQSGREFNSRQSNSTKPEIRKGRFTDCPIFDESKFFKNDYDAGHVPMHCDIPKLSTLNKMAETHFIDEVKKAKGDVVVYLVDDESRICEVWPQPRAWMEFNSVSKDALLKIAPYVGVHGHTGGLTEKDNQSAVLWTHSILSDEGGFEHITVYPACGKGTEDFWKIFEILSASTPKPVISTYRFTKKSLGKYIKFVDNWNKDYSGPEHLYVISD